MRGTFRMAAIVAAIAAPAAAVVAGSVAAPSVTVGPDPAAISASPSGGAWRERSMPTILNGRSALEMAPTGATDLAAVDDARARSLRGSDEQASTVRVVAETRAGAADAVRARITSLGGQVELSSGTLVQARVPAAEVDALAADDGVRRVRPPAVFVPAGVPGEGVSATSAPLWQAHGLTGKGVKVAIFDSGFAGLAERQAAGEVPASAVVVDLCNGHAGGPSSHGTAVAELVADQAPEAQLYLVCIESDVSLAAAVAYAKANGVRVVNMSGGFYNTWRGDGRGPAGTPDAAVADARAAGILWVNAAGNEALSHWAGSFASADGDPFHEFVPGNEVNGVVVPAGNVVCGALRWDSWPTTTDDFDLGFYDPEFGIVAVSDDYQVGTGLPPTEALCLENNFATARVAGFFIYRYAGTGTPSFDLFVVGSPYDLVIQHAVAARSLVDPAGSPNAVAAGAACWQSGAIEPYSSQGPTIDGRIKPDVAAPDSVTTATFGGFTACGGSGFAGTSAAAPHVAGVAALLRQRFPALPIDQLQALLLAETADAGTPGVDNAYGAGNLRLRELPQAVLKARPVRAKAGRSARVGFSIEQAQWDVRGHVHVFRGAKQVNSFVLPFAPTRGTTMRSVIWRAPARTSAGARYRFCAEGWDRAGHESQRSCAAITLTR